MSAVNDTKSNSAVFLLTGIPGLEDVHLWIPIPFCLMYIISVVGNSVILFIIKIDPSLHEPMYIFLSMLSITDLGLSIAQVPSLAPPFVLPQLLAKGLKQASAPPQRHSSLLSQPSQFSVG
ncbi:unnamed protein product [Natator depressus]